ncbi:MAG: hypothetical protein AAF485_25895, partial [Chloroflexota bacterium]
FKVQPEQQLHILLKTRWSIPKIAEECHLLKHARNCVPVSVGTHSSAAVIFGIFADWIPFIRCFSCFASY